MKLAREYLNLRRKEEMTRICIRLHKKKIEELPNTVEARLVAREKGTKV